MLCVSFLFLSLALPSRSAARSRDSGFLDRTLSLSGIAYKYQVFLPDNWKANRKWPIILFLHGYGERGSDGLLQTDVGLPHAIRLDRSRFPAVVVIPQCQMDHWWAQRDMEEIALKVLAAATKEFKGDPKRTYLTGLSMGAYASWDLAARFPVKFAAVVPVSGGAIVPGDILKDFPDLALDGWPSETVVAQRIGKTPVWIFHGAADDTVPVEYSRKMNDALKQAGGDVHYTEYPSVGHNSWDRAYAEPDFVPWLLSKSL